MHDDAILIDAPVMPFLRLMTTSARERLTRFVETARETGDGTGQVFHPVDFAAGSGVAALVLSVNGSAHDRRSVNCELWLDDDTRWRNGTFQLPCGRLPDSILSAMVGRRLHEVAGGAMVEDAVIEDAVNSGARVRLTCRTRQVPVDLSDVRPAIGATEPRDVGAMKAGPIAAHVLRTMTREQSLHAIAWLHDACTRDELDCGMPWSAFATDGLPTHLSTTTTTWSDATPIGRVRLRIEDDTVHVLADLVGGGRGAGFKIGKWAVRTQRDFGATTDPRSLLGFALPGIPLLHRMNGTGGGTGVEPRYIVSGDVAVAEMEFMRETAA